MYKYKPCPFCGTIPQGHIEVTRWAGDELTLSLMLKCPKCGIKLGSSYKSNGNMDFNDFTGCMSEVVGMWNDRYYCNNDLTK